MQAGTVIAPPTITSFLPALLVQLIPNTMATHAITYTNYATTLIIITIMLHLFVTPYIIVRLQNIGIYGIYNPKALVVGLEQSEGATKGLRVINYIPSSLRFEF